MYLPASRTWNLTPLGWAKATNPKAGGCSTYV